MRIRDVSRYELKYVLDWDQYQRVAADLASYLEPDRHGDQVGQYLVTSLYYDTADHTAYWDKIDGHRFRRKVRVRTYGVPAVTPDTLCWVEIKQRTNKTLQKKRAVLPYAAAAALCGTGQDVPEVAPANRALIEEVQYLTNTLQLQPACVVSYDRLAFNGGEYDPGLRVTFDTGLKCRAHDLTLLSESYATNRYFLPPDSCIMEIKINQRVPYWLMQIVNSCGCTLRRIGKYCLALERCKAISLNQRIVS
jgi:hypothetical protein